MALPASLSSYKLKGVSFQLKERGQGKETGKKGVLLYKSNGGSTMTTGRCCCLHREEETCSQLALAFQEKIFPILYIFDFSKVFLVCTGMNPSFLEIFAKTLLFVWQER